jgi:arginine/ornithine N-succinyltransferase beta subunit
MLKSVKASRAAQVVAAASAAPGNGPSSWHIVANTRRDHFAAVLRHAERGTTDLALGDATCQALAVEPGDRLRVVALEGSAA